MGPSCHPHTGVRPVKGQGQHTVPQGLQVLSQRLSVLPGDGVDNRIAVRVPNDGVGGDGHPVVGVAGPHRDPHPVQDLRLGGRTAQHRGKHLPRRGEDHCGPRSHRQNGGSCHGHGRTAQIQPFSAGAAPLQQAVHHRLLLLLCEPQLVHGLPICFHVNASCSSCVRSLSLPRLSRVATVAGFSPSIWAISLAE